MSTPDLTTSVALKVDPKVSVGLTTIVGIGAAVGQFLGSILLMLQDGKVDPEDLTPLVTGAATLYGVIQGRMKQAAEAIKSTAPPAGTVVVNNPGA
jgi:hypothetical protein